jgi:hypothetical protein
VSARDPIAFLDAVAGYAAERNMQGSADRPIKLATVDPAYVASSYPATLPKVTFDGEGTLTGKRYPVLSGYLPRASDRVVMLPCGNTYVVLGSLDADAVGFGGGGFYQSDAAVWEAYENTNDTFTSTSYVTTSTMGTDFVAPQSGVVLVQAGATIGNNAIVIAGTSWTVISFEVRTGTTVGSGTVVISADDARSARMYVQSTAAGMKYAPAARAMPVGGLTPGAGYNVRPMFKVGASTGAYLNRWVVVTQSVGPIG